MAYFFSSSHFLVLNRNFARRSKLDLSLLARGEESPGNIEHLAS